ncbi:MAG TPA: VanZ family protein [Candidatus Merdicola faecigallinarum]|uniref:VanZ family protein n=1 Tax=Candidatus Merdicola faecigallinarum TaxID=2840862 RepID=A0A9D1M1L2_9FIRM|nr:VanZ family protein [Candidatus Merdicola faecigallinarum]
MLIFEFINTYNIDVKRKITYSFIIGVIYAITDEIHQLFVPGRSGEIRDVLIDGLGIIVGIILIYQFKKKRGKI